MKKKKFMLSEGARGGAGGGARRGRANNLQIDKAKVDEHYANGSWARQMPNGKESCVEHQKGECNLPNWERCGKNHQCPKVLSSTGAPCGLNHRAQWCTNT